MAIEHIHHDDTNSTNTALIVLVILVALVLGFFVYKGLGTNRTSTIDVNLPNLGGATNSGGTPGQTQ